MNEQAKADAKADPEHVLSVLLAEYEALKSEQLGRIGFRDNLLYATIGAVGAIGAVALGGLGEAKEALLEAFLLVPWVTTILGWTYLVNDDKITEIRRYVDGELSKQIQAALPSEQPPFRWEVFHRADPRRSRRKAIQLAVDLVTFIVSGFGAIAFFLARAGKPHLFSYGLAALEFFMLLFLGYEIVMHDKKAQSSGANLGDGASKGGDRGAS